MNQGDKLCASEGTPHVINFNLSSPSFMCGGTADWLQLFFLTKMKSNFITQQKKFH